MKVNVIRVHAGVALDGIAIKGLITYLTFITIKSVTDILKEHATDMKIVSIGTECMSQHQRNFKATTLQFQSFKHTTV